MTKSNLPEISGFEVVECLGTGGLATVYKARQIYLDREVALKILPPKFECDAATLDQFRSEAITIASLKHPHIVQIYEAGQDGNRQFIVMELIRGYSIGAWLDRKGYIPPEEALVVAEYVAQALQYAWHKAQVVHGDLKPDNIMVDEDGTIKVADFLALPRRGIKLPESLARDLIGTPNYMSPEQILGERKLDCRSDIYSLGTVLYHMVTGWAPFSECSDDDAILESHLNGRLSDILEINRAIPTPLAWLIEKMLVKEPDGRQSNWDEVLSDLALVRNGQLPASSPPLPYASTLARSPLRQIQVGSACADPPPPTQMRKSLTPLRPSRPPRDFLLWIERIVYSAVVIGLVGMFSVLSLRGRRPLDPRKQTNPALLIQPMPFDITPQAEPPEIQEEKEPDGASYDESESLPAGIPSLVTSEQPLHRENELAELRAYYQIIDNIVPLLAARQYDQVRSLIQRWLGNVPPAHSYRARVAVEIDRLDRLLGLYDLLRLRVAKLRGQIVRAGANTEGELVDIRSGKILLSRSGAIGARATFEYDWMTIHDRDMQTLLELAATHESQGALAIWALSKGQIQVASDFLESMPANTIEPALAAWIADWRFALRNAQADRALDSVGALLKKNAIPEARLEYARALEAYGDTLIFSRLRQAELEDLARMITPAKTTDQSKSKTDLLEETNYFEIKLSKP